MNEIEKMYEKAGLSNMWVQRYNDGYYEHERYYNSYKEMINNMMKANDWTLTEAQEVAKRECRKEHPPFTAEKQLNLIKWLIQKDFYDERIIRSNFEQTYFYCTYIDDYCESEYFEKFEEALANVFNYFWQFLTEEERRRIKDILQ